MSSSDGGRIVFLAILWGCSVSACADDPTRAASAATAGLANQSDLSAPGLYCQPFSYVGDNGGLLDTFEFLFTPGRVTLVNEMGLVRCIFTDGRPIPTNIPETNAGYSVGHWEGQTLVVETVALDADARYPVE